MPDVQIQSEPQTPPVPVQPNQVQQLQAAPQVVQTAPQAAPPQAAPPQAVQPQAGMQTAPQPAETASSNGSAYDQMIQQLQAQNAALMQQNELLNQQVIRMVNNGAQFTHQPQQSQQPQHVTQADQMQALGMQFEPPASYEAPSLSKVGDMTLESLAGEIGKK